MYTNDQIDRLKKQIPSWQVAESRVSNLKRDGREYKGLCPLHEEKTPSFTCFEKDGVWLWRCFGCGKSGNSIQLVQECDKISFSEAVEKMTQMLGWEKGKQSVEKTFKTILEKEKSKITFPISAIAQAESALGESEEGKQWLAGRGISLDTAKRFHLGYVQNAGAINPTHPYVDKGWILFPSISDGKIVLLKYRSVIGKKTPDGKSCILRKQDMATTLYNVDSVSPLEDVFLVEGEPDTLIMSQAGYSAVGIPNAGFSLTPEMRDKIVTANCIYLAGDTDAVGRDTMKKLWTELRDRTYLIEWPDGIKDANEFYLKVCKGDVEEFKKRVEELKQTARQKPMPFMYDLAETLTQINDISPLNNPARLRFPWETIDKWTAILPGDVVCLSATDSGTGKTSWLMNLLLYNAIKFNKVIVNYSAEILPDQYARRAAAYITRQSRDTLKKEDFFKASEIMKEAKFYNGYKPGADHKEVLELLRWAKRRMGADILVIDHLHFLTRSEKDEIKAQSEAMRAIKDLALEYNVIIIVVGQPRKPTAQYRGRIAQMYDIKGSESIMSDSSQVIILHRNRTSEEDAGTSAVFSPITKVVLDKSRESEARSTELVFKGEICGFFEIVPEQGEAGF
jgi:DNA primase